MRDLDCIIGDDVIDGDGINVMMGCFCCLIEGKRSGSGVMFEVKEGDYRSY